MSKCESLFAARRFWASFQIIKVIVCTYKLVSEVSWASSVGMGPLNWLSDKSLRRRANQPSLWIHSIPEMNGGFFSYNLTKEASWPSWGGIGPLNWLLRKLLRNKLDMVRDLAWRKFVGAYSFFSEFSWDSCEGIGPFSLLLCRCLPNGYQMSECAVHVIAPGGVVLTTLLESRVWLVLGAGFPQVGCCSNFCH